MVHVCMFHKYDVVSTPPIIDSPHKIGTRKKKLELHVSDPGSGLRNLLDLNLFTTLSIST